MRTRATIRSTHELSENVSAPNDMKTKHHTILSALAIQGGDQTLNNPIRSRWFALGLGGFLFSLILALSPSAEAQCKRWDVSGNWVIEQSNGIHEALNLQQGKWQGNSAHLTGTAAVSVPDPANGSFSKPQYAGAVSGGITDNVFTLLIKREMAQYRYTGVIGPSGKIEGTNDIKVRWVGSRSMKCADARSFTFEDKKERGFINGLPSGTPTPTPSAEANESSSSDTEDQQGKHKKNKKKNKKKHRHHHDDDENQGDE